MPPPPLLLPPLEQKSQAKSKERDAPAAMPPPEAAHAKSDDAVAQLKEAVVVAADDEEAQRQKMAAGLLAQYAAPSWEPEKPVHPYHVEVLKNGAIIDKIDISAKGHYFIGRLPCCDIPMEHPLVSRVHAVIQHRDDGFVFVYDLSSANGTFVNKQRLQPRCYQYYLTGDVLRIGESTRLFILGGGPPRDEQATQIIIAQAAQQQRHEREEENEETWCSWGEREDALPEPDEQDEKQKDKGVAATAEDDAEDCDVNELCMDRFGKTQTADVMPWLEPGEELIDSDDDQFYDRTAKKKMKASKKSSKKPENVMTYDSLFANKTELLARKDKLQQELDKKKGAKTDGTAAVADPLDAFMAENVTKMESESTGKLTAELQKVEMEILQVDHLLKLAQPALQPLQKPQQKRPAAGSVAEAPVDKKQKTGNPPKGTAAALEHFANEQRRQKLEKERLEKEQQQQADGVALEALGMVARKNKKKQPPVMTGQQPQKQQQKQKQQEYDEEVDYAAWAPPSGQTGDGKTSLNEKLGY
eukprot:TRINITY_DN4586_c0_g3_i4.p2 TRINITY_DN4586_c0_g3~~TRINITY_DN4586_c0_g3_i4.p2  ORF type:complete len:588 (+),score=218.07 TRINITY_DN4586_c0_g3_i4:178-1764(+)